MTKTNPAKDVLTRVVNRCIAEGAPVYVSKPLNNIFYQVCLTERNGDATQLLPYTDDLPEAIEIASRLRAYLYSSHFVELLRHIETGDGESFENSSIETAKLTF